jgi:hypothetical protein
VNNISSEQPSQQAARVNKRIAAIAVCLILGSAATGIALGKFFRRGAVGEPPSPSVISAERLRFGEVWEDSRFPWTITLRNGGAEDIRIEEFVTDCDCHDIDPKTLTIPAGGSGDVRLILDLSFSAKEEGGAKPRAFGASLKARLAGETQPDRSRMWTISGDVRPAISISSANLDLGRVSERMPPKPLERVEIVALVPLERISASINSREFVVKVERDEKTPMRFTLCVAPSRSLVRGEKAVEISVTPFDKDGRKLGTRKLPLKATVSSDIQPTTSGVLFGVHDVGAQVTETIMLRSMTDRECTAVEKVACEGTALDAESIPSPAKGVLAVAVRLRIPMAGAFAGKVRATVRCADGSLEETSFDVSAYGIEAAKR